MKIYKVKSKDFDSKHVILSNVKPPNWFINSERNNILNMSDHVKKLKHPFFRAAVLFVQKGDKYEVVDDHDKGKKIEDFKFMIEYEPE